MCAAERVEFEAYAAKFGLDAASLLALLLARELRIERLADLLHNDVPSKASRDSKVTVHGRDTALRNGIVARAEKCGTSLSNACAVLMRAEMHERWLERSIRLDSSRIEVETVLVSIGK